MSARTYVIDTEAVVAYIQSGLDNPAYLAAQADGLRQRILGWRYFERPDSVFWHELTDTQRAPWLARARAEIEALR